MILLCSIMLYCWSTVEHPFRDISTTPLHRRVSCSLMVVVMEMETILRHLRSAMIPVLVSSAVCYVPLVCVALNTYSTSRTLALGNHDFIWTSPDGPPPPPVRLPPPEPPTVCKLNRISSFAHNVTTWLLLHLIIACVHGMLYGIMSELSFSMCLV